MIEQDKESSSSEAAIKDTTMIVGVVNGTYFRIRELSSVPPGTRLYTAYKDILEHSKEQIEQICANVQGTKREVCKDKPAAANNLWHAFSRLPEYKRQTSVLPGSSEDEEEAPPKSKESEKLPPQEKREYKRRRNESTYVIRPPTDRKADIMGKLAPQAQILETIMRSSGKSEFPESELRELLDEPENFEKLNTKQPSWRIFQYYRSKLIQAHVLLQK